MNVCMMRVTISLPDDLASRLRREARRRSTAVSEIVRDAVQSALGDTGAKRIAFAGVGSSGASDISERVDEILRDEWVPKKPSRVRGRRR
jgi:hypothetical protein